MSSFAQAAAHYDLLYSGIKDYEAESRRLRDLIRTVPSACRVLDVGCGTGMHSQFLSQWFLVDGIDIEPQFIQLAGTRNPAGRFAVGDMRSLTITEPYDAVLCLFGSIGYATDRSQLDATMRCLSAAVRPGGIVIVEPWLEPEAVYDGYVAMHSARAPDVVVSRVSRTRVLDAVSRLEFQYLVARASGIEHITETHDLGLFTCSTMLDSFAQAGLVATHDPEGPHRSRALCCYHNRCCSTRRRQTSRLSGRSSVGAAARCVRTGGDWFMP